MIKSDPQTVVDRVEEATGLEVFDDSITEILAGIDEGQETIANLAAETVSQVSEPPALDIVESLVHIDTSILVADAEITRERTPYLPVPNVYESDGAPRNSDPTVMEQPVPGIDTPKPEPDQPSVVVAVPVVAAPVIDEPNGEPDPAIVAPVPEPTDPGTPEEPDTMSPVSGPASDDEREAAPSDSTEHRRSRDRGDAASPASLSVLTSGGMTSPAASMPLLLALFALLSRRVGTRPARLPDDVFGTVPVPPG